MVSKVTNTLTQIGLAVLAAIAFIFPSPEEAIDAARDVVSFSKPETPITDQAVVQIEPSLSHTQNVVIIDRIENCISGQKGMALEDLISCAEVLYQEMRSMERPIRVAQFEKLIGRDQTYDDYETIRLALLRLCRAIWTLNDGSSGALSTPSCYWTVQGVEKPT